jgi:uncharacterized protein (TIGR02001 family)
MKILKTALLAATAALAVTSVAQAADGPTLSANVGVASDYVFRGVSQTNGDPELFGGLDLTAGQAYAGVWLSNVDFGDGTRIEYDTYAGIKPEVAGFNLDLGVVYYSYLESPKDAKYGYGEVKAAASRAIGKATVGAAYYYSPDFFGADEKATYVELNGAYAINDTVSVTGAYGHQALDVSKDYNTWNLGASIAVMPKLSLDVRYWDTSEHDIGSIYESRFAATLKASF